MSRAALPRSALPLNGARDQSPPPPRLRFRRRRPVRPRRDPRAAAGRAAGLRRRQRRLSLRHQAAGRDRGAGPRPARPARRALRSRADRHRLQHRLDDRPRRGAGGARPAGRRHGAGDQAGRGAVDDPDDRGARHRGDGAPALCRPAVGASSPPTAPSSATARPSWSTSPRRSCAARLLDGAVCAGALDGLFAQPGGERIDTIVLACTHFPLVEAELAAAAPRPVRFVDGKEGIARRTAWLTRDLRLAGASRRRASRCSPAGTPTSRPIAPGSRATG